MRIAGIYPFKEGDAVIRERYPHLLQEIETVIEAVDANLYKSKASKEKTMPGRVLYSPKLLNVAFREGFKALGWQGQRVYCEYPTCYYTADYQPRTLIRGAFWDMDFVKEQLGVEVQFGKYAFMVYNVCAKMTICHNMGYIDAGVEIVPVREFATEMSSGVAYFEQFVWDLEQRGVADIDIPVMVIGVNV